MTTGTEPTLSWSVIQPLRPLVKGRTRWFERLADALLKELAK